MQPKILTLTTLLATTLAIPSPFSIRQESCEAKADACRTAPEANQAYCSAQYAACLGYNPYTGSSPTSTTVTYAPIVTGTNPTPTPIYPIPAPYNGTTPIPIYTNETSISTYGYSTSVVSSFSTYVPGPTTITFGSATYTATGPTTMTVSDCPCTLTVPITTGATPIPVPATTPAGNGGSGPSPTTTGPGSTTTSPSSYVGAANVKEPAVGLAVVAMGALALLM